MSQLTTLPEPPYRSPMIDQRTGYLTDPWNKWFQLLYLRVGGAVSVFAANANPLAVVTLFTAYATAAAALVYTSALGQKTLITSFSVQNVTSVAQTLSVYFVPAGSSPGSTNILLNAVSIPGNTTESFSNLVNQVLNGGDMIYISAGAPGTLLCIAKGKQST
jgi:hypothetical protein